MTDDDIKLLLRNGFKIGSNGIQQHNMCALSKQTCKLELELSKRMIEKKIGSTIDYFAAPFGGCDRKMIKLAYKAGYKKMFAARSPMVAFSNNFIVNRFDIDAGITATRLKNILMNKLRNLDRNPIQHFFWKVGNINNVR